MAETKEDWVKETQMFQRIAKVKESSTAELELEYDKMVAERHRQKIERSLKKRAKE